VITIFHAEATLTPGFLMVRIFRVESCSNGRALESPADATSVMLEGGVAQLGMTTRSRLDSRAQEEEIGRAES
jgi:hypothetical protein